MAMDYPVATKSLVGVEHPCIVRRVSEAIRSLGGSQNLGHLVAAGTMDQEAMLYLKPDDPMSVPISSHTVASNDLLLAIRVPRIIGRKRKRPLEPSSSPAVGDTREATNRGREMQEIGDEIGPSKRLLRSFKDYPERAQLEVVGAVSRTHRFRDLPDFGFATSTGPFMKQFQEKLLSFDYDLIKQYRFDMANPKSPTTEIIPPPTISPAMIPFNYLYRQNTLARKVTQESGKVEVAKSAKSYKTFTARVGFDVINVPSEPSPNMVPLQSLEKDAQELVAELKVLFDRRPIWTRRAIVNQIKKPLWKSLFKHAHQYVAYMFRSGPWRESLVKLGVDPRRDPSFRIYQTMFFILDVDSSRNEKATPKKPGQTRGGARRAGVSKPSAFGVDELGDRTHIFDGEKVAIDSKVWQVCDITDPQLVELLSLTDLRRRCHVKSDGWFHNGTWAKARLITRTKIHAIMRGDLMLYSPSLERIAQFPDYVDAEARTRMQTSRQDSPNLIELAEQLRAIVTSPEPIEELADANEVPLPDTIEEDPRVREAMLAMEAHPSAFNAPEPPSDEGDDDMDDGSEGDDDDAAIVYPADYDEPSDAAREDDDDE